jgi:hypothetical protein
MTPEGKIEAHLKKRVKALGGEVRKMRWIGRVGAPDRVVLLPDASVAHERSWRLERKSIGIPERAAHSRACQHILVELKAPGKKPTKTQLREHERLRDAGFVVLVLDSVEAIDALFGR